MAAIVDVVILFVLLGSLWLGGHRGLLQSVAGLVIVVVAFFGAAWSADHFSEPVAEWVQPLIEQRIEEKLHPEAEANGSAVLAEFCLDKSTLRMVLNDAAERVKTTGQSAISAVVESMVHSTAYGLVYAVSFLVLFLVLHLLVKPLNLAARLPGLRTANVVLGGALGLICGIMLLCVAAWVLQRLDLILTPEIARDSFLLKYFTEGSPVSLIASI
jgi:uncharacterized membrane protein required for colicin V production